MHGVTFLKKKSMACSAGKQTRRSVGGDILLVDTAGNARQGWSETAETRAELHYGSGPGQSCAKRRHRQAVAPPHSTG